MANRVEQFQTLYQQGLELLSQNRDEEAMSLLYTAAKIAPEGWLALAVELLKDGKSELALERFHEVLKLSKVPKVRAAALNNIGMIWANSGRNEEAMRVFAEASEIAPEFPDTWSNIALMHKWKFDFTSALYYANKALARDPWHEQACFIRSMIYLLSGDYARGWEEYECRWRSKSNGLAKIATPFPEWNGRNGKRVFIYGEQGHGDTILMLRYARLIKERGLEQVWVVQKSMSPLAQSMGIIDLVMEPGHPVPEFDCHIPAVSLPRIFNTRLDTIPPAPYIPEPEPMDYGPGFHVGICWRGSKGQGNDMIRSTNLKHWSELLALPGITFHSLQVDCAEEALLYPQIKMYEKPADWLDTARRIAGLDLVVSVDTSIVHVSGAIGKRCLVPMHCRPYFVYPPKSGKECPWYSTVILFRQKREFEWEHVFGQIAEYLRGYERPNTR